jgi:hypothetical protein
MFPCLYSESLSPSAGLFALALMIGTRSNLISRKSCLKALLGGNLLIQSSVSPDIFAVSKIFDLVSSWVDSYVDTPTIEPAEVVNQRKIAYCKRNTRKVSVVLLRKCPEPFAGIGYD